MILQIKIFGDLKMRKFIATQRYEAPIAVILTPSDELLDRQSLNIGGEGGNDDDLDIDFDYDDFWGTGNP